MDQALLEIVLNRRRPDSVKFTAVSGRFCQLTGSSFRCAAIIRGFHLNWRPPRLRHFSATPPNKGPLLVKMIQLKVRFWLPVWPGLLQLTSDRLSSTASTTRALHSSSAY